MQLSIDKIDDRESVVVVANAAYEQRMIIKAAQETQKEPQKALALWESLPVTPCEAPLVAHPVGRDSSCGSSCG